MQSCSTRTGVPPVLRSAVETPLCPHSVPPWCGAIAVTVTVAWDGMRASVQAQPLLFEFGTSMLNTRY